jgi:hypothetical protein
MRCSRNCQFHLPHGTLGISANGEMGIMSESVSTSPRLNSTRRGSADRDAFAQVEKWMAVIREISREQVKS